MLKGGKDLRVGLLLLMASMDTVAREPMDYETELNGLMRASLNGGRSFCVPWLGP